MILGQIRQAQRCTVCKSRYPNWEFGSGEIVAGVRRGVFISLCHVCLVRSVIDSVYRRVRFGDSFDCILFWKLFGVRLP